MEPRGTGKAERGEGGATSEKGLANWEGEQEGKVSGEGKVAMGEGRVTVIRGSRFGGLFRRGQWWR